MEITLAKPSIDFFRDLITGDSSLTPYRSGFNLVRFFNDMGFKNIYDDNFPSRWKFTEDRLNEINGDTKMQKCIEKFFDPRNFINEEQVLYEVVQKFNKYLDFDGYQIQCFARKVKVVCANDELIRSDIIQIDNEFIAEELEKCEVKINEEDYAGAITNARSLIETIFLYVYVKIYDEELVYDGDFIKLHKKIQTALNLSPENVFDKVLKQILQGLTSVVVGVSTLRNRTGDAHGRINPKYKPDKHHAILAVNCAKTLLEFMLSSYNYQQKRKEVRLSK